MSKVVDLMEYKAAKEIATWYENLDPSEIYTTEYNDFGGNSYHVDNNNWPFVNSEQYSAEDFDRDYKDE